MRELKKSAYNNAKAIVIASRHQLCVNPNLKESSNTDKIYMCKKLVETSKCKFHKNVERIIKEPELQQNIIDIEDLHQIARKHEACPFYISKEKVKGADILFMPYNYLIDPRIRISNDIKLMDSIVILDEAHNVNKVCEDSASTSIEFAQIHAALRDINDYVILFSF